MIKPGARLSFYQEIRSAHRGAALLLPSSPPPFINPPPPHQHPSPITDHLSPISKHARHLSSFSIFFYMVLHRTTRLRSLSWITRGRLRSPYYPPPPTSPTRQCVTVTSVRLPHTIPPTVTRVDKAVVFNDDTNLVICFLVNLDFFYNQHSNI